MKHLRRGIVLTVAAALVLLLGAAALAAGGADDPVVSLGYLEKVFAPSVYVKVDEAVKANEETLKAALDKSISDLEQRLQTVQPATPSDVSASFEVVTLSRGQTLTGQVGCEVMLRVGAAVCVSSGSPGLIDTTSGAILGNGQALETNHLYMITIATREVRATAGTVKVLARGGYTVS